ncbi:UNVERIFIED_CONTAM: hypothetical protein NCL1_53861 [Trichonephila clavipes]
MTTKIIHVTYHFWTMYNFINTLKNYVNNCIKTKNLANIYNKSITAIPAVHALSMPNRNR